MSSYNLNIFTPQELNHSSYIQTGLFELEKEGFLKTKVQLSFAKRLGTIKILNNQVVHTNEPHPKTSFYELEDKLSSKKIKFATDLYDASYSFSSYALEHCDYVFKRNFEKEKMEMLPKKYQDKLFPLGLTFKVVSENRKSSFKFLIGLLISNLLISFKLDRNSHLRIFKSLKKQLKHWRNFKKSTSLELYSQVNSKIESSILFQTRCFANEDSKDVKEIHQQRNEIIKLLREKFSNTFKGGFIPSKMVKKNYKDAITNLPTEPLAYLNEIKKAKFVIYTRGLVNSPAWKMAEYLSQGKIIIAERLTTQLPVSLTNGKEVLFFDNEEEISTIIENTMLNEELCISLAKNARCYFEQNVHPKENLKRILTFMLQNNNNV